MNSLPNSDRQFMELAVAEAARSDSPGQRILPLVGAVAVRDTQVLATAYRGELSRGEHAEFTLLERHLSSVPLEGATIFTTLEPCSLRSHPKVSCAERMIERRVGRVVVGMLDPNPRISGRGLLLLSQARITTELFPSDLAALITSQNAAFVARARAELPESTSRISAREWELLESNGFLAGRSQQEWYEYFLTIDDLRSLNRLRSFYHPPEAPISVAGEVTGGASDIVVVTDVRILKSVAADANRLLTLTPREFEVFTAELLERLGYSNVVIGQGSKDGGVDVTAYISHALGAERVIVQCKRHALEHKVGEPIIKQLLADVGLHHAARGLIATTSYLTRGARVLVEQEQHRLSALDHDTIRQLLREPASNRWH
jgi:pyrimidine deaminase RibD-like protein